MEYAYREETINEVLKYLGTKPYFEVKTCIDLLMAGRALEPLTGEISGGVEEEILPELDLSIDTEEPTKDE